MLHQVRADEDTCAPQASLAVDGQAPWCALSKVQEAQEDVLGGAGAVWEVQLVVLEAACSEALGLVNLHAQPSTEQESTEYFSTLSAHCQITVVPDHGPLADPLPAHLSIWQAASACMAFCRS